MTKSTRYKITILTDENSWMEPYIRLLVQQWAGQRHQVVVQTCVSDAESADFCFGLSLGKIVPKVVRDRFRHVLVVHASDLPNGRGWSPMSWKILAGESVIPLTLLEAEDEVDSGAIYLQNRIHLSGTELSNEWRERLGLAVIQLCAKWLEDYPTILESATEQNGAATFYAKRTAADSQLDVDRTIAEQFNLLRIVDNERYPAFFLYKGKKYILRIEQAA